MPEFAELLRNILIVLALLAVLSWLLSLVRMNFAVRRIPGRKDEVFNRLLAILKDQQFDIKRADPVNSRIVTNGLVSIIDLVLYRLVGNRVVFQLRESPSQQEVQLRAYGYASFLFLKASIRRSDRDKVIDGAKVEKVLDALVWA